MSFHPDALKWKILLCFTTISSTILCPRTLAKEAKTIQHAALYFLKLESKSTLVLLMQKWMFAMSMRYASRYLELFSSYYNNRMEKRIIRLVDQYVFEPRKVLILVILERVEQGEEDGHWEEGKSLLMGRRELCELNADHHFLAHTPKYFHRRRSSKKSHSLMQENNKDFPFSPKWV